MAADPQALESPLWHAALRQSDDDAHRREDEWMRLNAVRALELRLAQANADRHALREAVHLRDRLLDEQRVALGERDALVADLQKAVARTGSPSLAGRVLRRGRRILGRVYRKLARGYRRVVR